MDKNLTLEQWTNNNELAISIIKNKYLQNGETLMEMIDRIAGGNEKVKQLILEKKYLPGGRICAGRGLSKEGKKISLSNCYVLPEVEDNLESIFDTAKEMARTYSYGGGCGLNISKLAFKGAKVRNAASCSSGAVSFMDLYSMVTGLIAQHGRRGALMISMDISHPDIEEFIDCKKDLNRVTKANISVMVNSEFMEAVKNNGEYSLRFERPETGEAVLKKVKARKIFRKLCQNNWESGEPGILFWDNINNYNLLSEDPKYSYAGTNPCAEEPLPAYGACLLGAINLSAFVKNAFTDEAYFDTVEFSDTIFTLVDELNVILDEGIPLHPLKQQRETATNWRQIGLGIMGLADMLIKLGIKYGSEKAITTCDTIGMCMANAAILASSANAITNGKYPKYNWKAISKSSFFKNNTTPATKDVVKLNGLRNSQLLTIAPTGSISNVLGISGGMEPIFANSYTRKTETLNDKDTYFKVYTPIVKEYMDKFGITDEKDLPDYFVTAHEISYKERIQMQAVWQKHIDASISSTVNLPESATVEDVENLYIMAHDYGLKGVTVFRNNCLRAGILTTNEKKKEKDDSEKAKQVKSETHELARGEVIKCPDHCVGLSRKLRTGCGNLHCLAYFDKTTGDLMETYLNKGSTGGCNNFMVGLSRMISMSARAGVSIYDIVDQLKSTGSCPSYATRKAVHGDTSMGACCPMAVGNALIDMYEEFNNSGYIKDNDKPIKKNSDKKPKIKVKVTGERTCPQCGVKLVPENGCWNCYSCGYTKCD